MYKNKKIRALFITFLFLISTISIMTVITDKVSAQSELETKLYFHHTGFSDELGALNKLNTDVPTNEKPIAWPPKFNFKVNSSIYFLENWLYTFIISQAFTGGLDYLYGDLNESEMEQLDEISDLLSGFEIISGGPLLITSQYIYENEEPLDIKGDIDFNLYFTPYIFSNIIKNVRKYNDQVEVSVYKTGGLFGYNKVANTTVDINTKILEQKIKNTKVTISDVEFTVNPGENLIFAVRIKPAETIGSSVIENRIDNEKTQEFLEDWAEKLVNESARDHDFYWKIRDWTVDNLIKNMFNTEFNSTELNYIISDMLNIYFELTGYMNTTEILTTVWDSLTAPSFVYDSSEYQSYVTLPLKLEDEENFKVYYLHKDNVMDETSPSSDEASQADLKNSPKWDGTDLQRSKILKKAEASVYIAHKDVFGLLNLGKSNIVANLIYDGEIIDTKEVEMEKNFYIFNPLFKSKPVIKTFVFDGKDTEIEYGKHLSLELSVESKNGTILGFLDNLHREYQLFYDSTSFDSSMTAKYEETDNIKISDYRSIPENAETVLQDKVTYMINITSVYDDEIKVNIDDFSEDEQEKWDIIISDEEFNILSGETKTISVDLISVSEDLDDYDNNDELEVELIVAGKTGKTSITPDAMISDDEIEFNIIYTIPEGVKIPHGENYTYVITIKNDNDGLYPDEYIINAETEHNSTVVVDYDKLGIDVDSGEKFNVNINQVIERYADYDSDKLYINITSEKSGDLGRTKTWTIIINTTIGTPNIFENIYHFFEQISDDLGLDDILGDYGPHFLILIILILIFFIIIIIIAILKKKNMELICLDRIKEIRPEEEAKYEITIKNPSSYAQNFEISAEIVNPTAGFEVEVDRENLLVDSKSEITVIVTVRPTDFVKADDWAEVKISATIPEKQKSEELSTMTTLIDAKADIKIVGVFHWPTKFKEGDIIKTSFKLENKGNASADNVTIILYVNGEEKNKVEGITIPSGGYADIEIPWVAVKGKNDVHIEVK